MRASTPGRNAMVATSLDNGPVSSVMDAPSLYSKLQIPRPTCATSFSSKVLDARRTRDSPTEGQYCAPPSVSLLSPSI